MGVPFGKRKSQEKEKGGKGEPQGGLTSFLRVTSHSTKLLGLQAASDAYQLRFLVAVWTSFGASQIATGDQRTCWADDASRGSTIAKAGVLAPPAAIGHDTVVGKAFWLAG